MELKAKNPNCECDNVGNEKKHECIHNKIGGCTYPKIEEPPERKFIDMTMDERLQWLTDHPINEI